MNTSPNENNTHFIKVCSVSGRITYGWIWQDQYGWCAETYPDGISWSHIDSKTQAITVLKSHYAQRKEK